MAIAIRCDTPCRFADIFPFGAGSWRGCSSLTSLVLLWLIILAIDRTRGPSRSRTRGEDERGRPTAVWRPNSATRLGTSRGPRGAVVRLWPLMTFAAIAAVLVVVMNTHDQVADVAHSCDRTEQESQAHQLGALVRAHLKAELVTAPTAAAALAALGDRIPDVVLTPALFGLRDEAALTERLRELGSDGSHVQTLAIPILAPAVLAGSDTTVCSDASVTRRSGCRLRPGGLCRANQDLSAARIRRAPGTGQRGCCPGDDRGAADNGRRRISGRRSIGVHGQR